MSNTGAKIAKLSTQIKLKWPKYDTDLWGYLEK